MFVINEFHFLRPLWLIALPIFYFMIFLSYKKMFRIGNWGNLVEPHLLITISSCSLRFYCLPHKNMALFLELYVLFLLYLLVVTIIFPKFYLYLLLRLKLLI